MEKSYVNWIPSQFGLSFYSFKLIDHIQYSIFVTHFPVLVHCNIVVASNQANVTASLLLSHLNASQLQN